MSWWSIQEPSAWSVPYSPCWSSLVIIPLTVMMAASCWQGLIVMMAFVHCSPLLVDQLTMIRVNHNHYCQCLIMFDYHLNIIWRRKVALLGILFLNPSLPGADGHVVKGVVCLKGPHCVLEHVLSCMLFDELFSDRSNNVHMGMWTGTEMRWERSFALSYAQY